MAVGRRADAGEPAQHQLGVGPYLPFANAFIFIGVQWLYPAYHMPWGEFGSLVYFAAVAAAVFVAALVAINRRDA